MQYNKAVVGRNAFAHEAGIHQHGVLSERTTYEIMDPHAVGQEGSKIVLGKHSGRHAFADRLRGLGLDIAGDALNAAFTRFKELADRKIELTDADLEAIAADEVGSTLEHAFELQILECHGGSVGTGTPSATVVVTVNGEARTAREEGNGMVDAACKAVKVATGLQGRLTGYSVTSVTGGVDALADVALRFESDDGVTVAGRGLSSDVVEASVRAFVSALNKVGAGAGLG